MDHEPHGNRGSPVLMLAVIDVQHELAKIESRIAWLTVELRRAEGIRDTLLRELLDNEGAHDRRPVAVR